MDIIPKERTIREILSAKCQYEIPRFQREYSWDKRNYKEFLEDMANNLSIKDGEPSCTSYFMGTMLFVGDPENNSGKPILVVDGQQRLTTITILFSAIARLFNYIDEKTLSKKVFEYIMSEDDNGNVVRVLKTVSSYPYFSYFIQSSDDDLAEEPKSEEEKNIKQTFDYFIQQLDEKNIVKLFEKLKIDIDGVKYVDLLKAIRDQILNSTVIVIHTKNIKIANQLFEILNAKGKQLAYIDLIKNKIFEYLDDTEPADFPKETWKEITDTLSGGKERTGIATFFRHYWSSKFKRSTTKELYDDFKKTVFPKDYRLFLLDFKKEAYTYQKITNPSRTDYENKKQHFWLVQSLNAMGNYFNVVQVRVPLLALYDAVFSRKIVSYSLFKKVVTYLEDFHFVYNAVLSKSANLLDSKYSQFSIALRECEDKTEANEIIKDKLITELEKLFPAYDEFEKGFIKFSYSKKDNPSNLRTKYALYKLNCYYSSVELFDDDGSIEHILSEHSDEKCLNIGNLIVLENRLNGEAGDMDYFEKIPIYRKSSYKWVNSFCDTHIEWSLEEIEIRAKELARDYYTHVIKRVI